MNPADELQKAFAPLLERTKRRAERVKQLQAQPPSPERDRAIAAEQREIKLFTQAAKDASRVVDDLTATTQHEVAAARVAVERVQDVVEEATHFEHLFHRTLLLPVGDPPDDQWPDVARRAQWAMYRMNHLRTSPDTYAATFGLKPTA